MRSETRPKPAYAHGAVVRPRTKHLLDLIDQLKEDFPISEEHLSLLRELGSEYVYATPITNGAKSARSWLVLLRFGAVLEARFGFTREIPVIYSPFTDLQIRTTDSLESHLANLPPDRRSVSSGEALIWAPDPRLKTKLDTWSRPARVLLPLPSKEALASADPVPQFVALLSDNLASRDLYSARGYVTGDQFFGRSAELQQVADCIGQREVIGVFGLRKTGKTSLLHELIQSHDSSVGSDGSVNVLVYQDLEYLPSLSEDPVPELIQDIAENIRRRLKSFNLRTQELADLPKPATPSEFRRALDTLLEKLEGEATLVLMLDEIEYLCPPDPGPDTTAEGYQRVRQLFGGLRKLVQERENFGFILAGLANSAVESPQLYGSPNPLFSFARALYLGPFSRGEAEQMLNTVGKRVSMHWAPDAVSLAQETSGGHALLLRELASCVLNDQKHARSNIAQIRPGQVHRVIPAWRQNVSSHVKDVLPHLRRYYQEEADLGILLMEDRSSFAEYAHAYPDNIRRLEQLGIVVHTADGSWMPSPLLEFSHGFEARSLPSASRTSQQVALNHAEVERLAAAEESEILEKKESLRAHGGKVPDDVIVDQVLKGCLGFLNRRGGRLLVGVADDGALVGIERDTRICGNLDKLRRFLTDKIRDKIGNVGVDLIQITDHTLGDVQILCLDVRPSPKPVFATKPVDGRVGLYVRNNNTTQLLNDKDAVDYIARHWPRS